MVQEVLINIESKEVRCAYLTHGTVQNFLLERRKSRQLTGNIYRGRVTNILHNIQSAFIDINEGDNGFIHINDILENTRKFEKIFEMDFDLDYDISKVDTKKNIVDIEEVLKIDQPVLVQVLKEPIGSKGARLTSNISIAGRYLVLLPNSSHRGVSRKIESRTERDRLKRLIRSFSMPQDMGLICRTDAQNASSEMLIQEAQQLLGSWDEVIQKFDENSGPACLFEESDIIRRTLLSAVQKKYDRVLIDHYPTFQRCKRLVSPYLQEHPLRIEYYRDKVPMMERFGVEKEIEKALRRKIWLPSGGYLYFDRTEAMHTVDVNSGRFSDDKVKSNLEETLVRINLEAAEEVARQLRLRNIGGLVICDFIDMRSRKNKRRVLTCLKECMKDDTAKSIILDMSDFGLVEMTRQRSRESLMQIMFTPCSYCNGSSMIKTNESVSIEIERVLKKIIGYNKQYGIRLETHPQLYKFLKQEDEGFLKQLAEKLNAQLEFTTNDELHLNEFNLYSTINGSKIEI
jgi:ribonuclease G